MTEAIQKLQSLVGAIPGKHDLYPPCEDSGTLAYACDLAPEETDNPRQSDHE